MTRKMSDTEAKRSPLNLRTTAELRARLDAAATAGGRSITQEVERRLEQSFDERAQALGDPLPGIFSDEVRRALRASQGLAQIIETVADVLFNTMKAARARDRSEEETRAAMRAALNLVGDRYLWREGAQDTPIEGPLASLGAHRLDYPPAHMGYEMANTRILEMALWREGDAAADAVEGRMRDLYSGAGRTVLAGPTEEEVEKHRQTQRAASMAARQAGDLKDEAPDQEHRYKTLRADPPVTDEGQAPSRHLKDIMGR
ncbi:hypothetical protein [Methylobacterium sp. NEAU K]|uniref:hypothetical protein n=1 Tax=Methylobacterium sp. NEAU K TaxID=3064946 RepID=UPI0027376290|nr:hypothetical protein [Methylobacterium sp. NEAU K]MDP4006517.1 hypothetical protein [Methylobacterium sp. NEAU K]